MITISKIVDSAALAVSRLVSEFKGATKLTGLITALANEAQAVEDALWALFLANRDPSVATGATLSNIGGLVGAPVRGLRTDALYRLRIAGQIVINRSSGESGSVYSIAKNLVPSWNVSNQPRTRETGTAQYTIGCDGVSFAIPTPTGLAFGSQITTGGTLNHGTTVAYRVSALSATGETLAAAEISRTLTGVTATNKQPIQWNAVAGATGYKVYGRTAGAELLMFTVAASAYPGLITFIDTGSITPAGALPVSATATFSNDTSLTNDMAQARELANVLADASSAGVRSIVRSRSDAVITGITTLSTDDQDYLIGDRVISAASGNAYQCVQAGHSVAVDIFGTGSDIPDSGDPIGGPHWKYLGLGVLVASGPGFFRFAGGTGPACGFGVGRLIGAYDR